MEQGFIISGCTKDQFLTELKQLIDQSSSPLSPDKLLTQKEACEYLQVSKPTLISWAKQGIVKSTKLQRRVYYKATDLLNISHKQ